MGTCTVLQRLTIVVVNRSLKYTKCSFIVFCVLWTPVYLAKMLTFSSTILNVLLYVFQLKVHPSTKDQRDASLGLEYYEFAGHIVGKCLFDSAIENPLFVKAHFSRSFLALLIGHRISWKVITAAHSQSHY